MNQNFRAAGALQSNNTTDLALFLCKVVEVVQSFGFTKTNRKGGFMFIPFGGDPETFQFRAANTHMTPAPLAPSSFRVTKKDDEYVVSLIDTGKYGSAYLFRNQKWCSKLDTPQDKNSFLNLISDMAGFYLKGHTGNIRHELLNQLGTDSPDDLNLRAE
jgi:hypothetical protein